MNEIVKKVLKNYLDDDDKINIPSKAKRVLFDIGASFAAPHTQIWTSGNDDVFVFTFDPNPICIESLKLGKWEKNPYGSSWKHELQLDADIIDDRVYLIEAALSSGEPRYSDFYCTSDLGTSSFYKPEKSSSITVDKKISTPTFSLEEIFKIFPWDRFPFIEHIKIDAQSADYDVILGMGEYINKVLYITVETNTINNKTGDSHYQFVDPNDDSNWCISECCRATRLRLYIESKGFKCKQWNDDGIFFNENLREYWYDKEDGFEYFNVDQYYQLYRGY